MKPKALNGEGSEHLFSDLNRLQNLVAMCGREAGEQLLDQLNADFSSARNRLAIAIDAKDVEAIRLQCHVLKGLAGTVGAMGLHNAAVAWGSAAHNNSATDPSLAGPTLSALSDLLKLLANDTFRRSVLGDLS